MPNGTFRPRMPGAGARLKPCATYEEAERLLDAAIAILADGDATPPNSETLRGFGRAWLDERELAGAESIATDRSRWRTHVETAPFADWRLAAIERHDVLAWMTALLSKRAQVVTKNGLKPKATRLAKTTIQNTLNLLRVAIDAALDKGLIRSNPARDVRPPRGRAVTHDPWTYLTLDEQQRLLASVGEDARDLIAFALGTGMREGEIWNLELRDVDLERRRVTVRYGKKGGSTKGRRIRRVPLFGNAIRALEAWLPVLATRQNAHGLVWPTATGERRSGAPREWQAWLEAAKLHEPATRHDGRHVRFHDLRHTCASSLVAGWWGRPWRLEEVKGLLGHRSITTTERYAHLADGVVDEAGRATEGLPIYPPADSASLANYAKRLAPSARVELTTNGLGSPTETGAGAAVRAPRGTTVDRGLAERAKAALDALARGGPEAWRLAVDVLGEVARMDVVADTGERREVG